MFSHEDNGPRRQGRCVATPSRGVVWHCSRQNTPSILFFHAPNPLARDEVFAEVPPVETNCAVCLDHYYCYWSHAPQSGPSWFHVRTGSLASRLHKSNWAKCPKCAVSAAPRPSWIRPQGAGIAQRATRACHHRWWCSRGPLWADPYRGAAQGWWVRLTVWAAEGSRNQIGCITRLRFETTPCVTF